MLHKNILYNGREEPLPEQKFIQVGNLSFIYEDGGIRYVKIGRHEILRRIYVAVRDQGWYSIPSEIGNLKVEETDESLLLSFDASNKFQKVNFSWKGIVHVTKPGTLTFSMEGIANTTFLKNRIGICVLHPIEGCSGKPCVVEKTDGNLEDGLFPSLISPHQPFKDMKAISYNVASDIKAEIKFFGEVFEMEDQRNWTDDSYKTYSTPLSLPVPVEVPVGAQIRQSVSIYLHGNIKEISANKADEKLSFILDDSPEFRLPKLGLSMASHGKALNQKEIAHLKTISLSHLRVNLTLYKLGTEQVLEQAAIESKQVNIPLEAAVYISNNAETELNMLLQWLGKYRPSVATFIIFHKDESYTDGSWVGMAREILSKYDISSRIGSGTDQYFAELNRSAMPVAGSPDVVCFPVTPQQHAYDNTTMVENLMAQIWSVQKAKKCVENIPVYVTPVMLKPHISPKKLMDSTLLSPERFFRFYDPRQMSLFAAGWTIGSIKYLSESGADSITYYETTGYGGVMSSAAKLQEFDLFPEVKDCVYPVFHILADIGEFAGGEVIRTKSSDRLKVEGLAMIKQGRKRVILCNLSPECQNVTVFNLSEKVWLYYMDERNVNMAMRYPAEFRKRKGEILNTHEGSLSVEMLPYAVMRLDLEG